MKLPNVMQLLERIAKHHTEKQDQTFKGDLVDNKRGPGENKDTAKSSYLIYDDENRDMK